jgi:hypothetical protein
MRDQPAGLARELFMRQEMPVVRSGLESASPTPDTQLQAVLKWCLSCLL